MNTEGLSLEGHMQKSRLPYTIVHSLPMENFYVHKPEASLSCFPLQSSQPYSTHPEEQTLNKQTAETHCGCWGWSHLSGETRFLSQSQQTKQPGS